MTRLPADGDSTTRKQQLTNSPADSGELFRAEVLVHQQSQWLGTVLLAPRISHTLFAAFAALAVAGLIALFVFADYARKARINGWLVPESGLVRVFAPQSGVVAQLHVHEGDAVTEGSPLILLSTETESTAYGAIRQEIVRQLLSRIDSMMTEREQQQQLYSYQLEDLSGRLVTMRDELRQLDDELALQRERRALSQAEVVRQGDLRDRGLVTEEPLVEARQDSLDQSLRLQALERDRIIVDRERLRLEGEIQQQPVRQETLLGGIDRQIATLQQELAEAESRRETVIVAPQDGTVTAIQATAGSSVGANAPLLSIVPRGSDLHAELFSPSSAIGFVRPGQQVLLRYDAFPYQKFGTHEGIVADISRSAVSPTEFPQQMSWITTVYGVNEPLYRITVTPASQSVTAYGESVPLQPGMRLEGDVVIEHRRLIEWVLDPLYTLTGR